MAVEFLKGVDEAGNMTFATDLNASAEAVALSEGGTTKKVRPFYNKSSSFEENKKLIITKKDVSFRDLRDALKGIDNAFIPDNMWDRSKMSYSVTNMTNLGKANYWLIRGTLIQFCWNHGYTEDWDVSPIHKQGIAALSAIYKMSSQDRFDYLRLTSKYIIEKTSGAAAHKNAILGMVTSYFGETGGDLMLFNRFRSQNQVVSEWHRDTALGMAQLNNFRLIIYALWCIKRAESIKGGIDSDLSGMFSPLWMRDFEIDWLTKDGYAAKLFKTYLTKTSRTGVIRATPSDWSGKGSRTTAWSGVSDHEDAVANFMDLVQVVHYPQDSHSWNVKDKVISVKPFL